MSTDGSSLTGLISLCRCCYSFREVKDKKGRKRRRWRRRIPASSGVGRHVFLFFFFSLRLASDSSFLYCWLMFACDLDFYFPPVSSAAAGSPRRKSLRVGRRCIEQKGFYLLDGSVRACGLTAGMIDHWRKENIDQVETDPPLQPAGASRMKMKEIFFFSIFSFFGKISGDV